MRWLRVIRLYGLAWLAYGIPPWRYRFHLREVEAIKKALDEIWDGDWSKSDRDS